MEEWQQKQEEEDKKIEEELKDYKDQEKNMRAAIHANTYKIDYKYKSQLEASASNIANGILLGKQHLKRKHKDLEQLTGSDPSKDSRFDNLNTLTGDIHKNDNIDDEALFFQSNKRKMKRFKVAEDTEKELKDDQDIPEPQEKEVESLMVVPPTDNIILKSIPEQSQNLPVVENIQKLEKDTKNSEEVKNEEPEPNLVSKESVLDILSKIDSIEALKKTFTVEQIKDNLVVLG